MIGRDPSRFDLVDEFRAEIQHNLGHAPDRIEPGKLQRFATRDQRGDDAGFAKMFEDQRAGIYGCNRQFPGQVFTWKATQRSGVDPIRQSERLRQIAQARREREAEQHRRWAAISQRLASLWDLESRPVPADGSGDDPVTLYLRHRLMLPAGEPLQVPAVLRWHPGLPYHIDKKQVGRWPAMVARLDAGDGRMLAIHRTWLTMSGRKAPVPGPVKKLTPACGHTMGGCIRLGWLEPGRRKAIGVAEGIETALAARCASGMPVVAAYSAGALAAWQWPPGTRHIVVFADADSTGAAAAECLRARASRSGLSAMVMTPSTPGADWCDVWAQRAAVAVAASEAAA